MREAFELLWSWLIAAVVILAAGWLLLALLALLGLFWWPARKWMRKK